MESAFRAGVGVRGFRRRIRKCSTFPYIPEPTRSEMTKELERRLLRLRILLEAFHTE